jgi:hypothetical protein
MKPGRKGSTDNVVPLTAIPSRPVLTPIGLPLTKQEREYFDFIARTNSHLKVSDTPMVMLLAASIVRAMKARARRQGDETFEKELRAALAVARSLRVTVQSTLEAKTAYRRRNEVPPSYYDQMKTEGDDQ